MKISRIGIFFLVLILCACNRPTRASTSDENPDVVNPSNTPRVSSPTPTQTLAAPTDTPIPSATPSPTATPDLSPPNMSSKSGDLVCRFGPGLRYGVGGSLREGVEVVITARNGAGDWFQFELPGYTGKYCWVASGDVNAMGELSLLNIAQAPLSFVTNVSVLLDPPVLEPSVCTFPLTFNVIFSIETIGPTFVTFRRSQSNGTSAPAETVEFTEAGSKTFEDYLRADAAGEHWFQVSVTSPNSVVGHGVGVVNCP